MSTVQFISDCLAQTHLRLMATCNGLTEEQMAWRPGPVSNNIGFILWHVTRNEDARVTRTAEGMPGYEADLWVSDGWHKRFDQPETAPDPGDRLGLQRLSIPGPDVLISYAEAVSSRTARFMETLAESRLDELMKLGGPNERVADGLRHMIVHKNNHHGQIDYLRGLQEEDWDLTPGTGRILPGRSA